MQHVENNSNRVSALSARVGAVFAMFLVFGTLFVASASAGLEQVGVFGEEQISGGQDSIAVNRTGAGGVPAGTVYTTTGAYVFVRYDPHGEFREGLAERYRQIGKKENGETIYEDYYERCGPDGEPAHPTCKFPEDGQSSYGIAVDQATGNVYVLGAKGQKGFDVVQVFNADGSQLIDSFAEGGGSGSGGSSIEKEPEKVHETRENNLAVDDSGNVYLSDIVFGGSENGASRVMVFKPQNPGDYEHYAYAGRANDIAASHDQVNYFPSDLAVDDADNLYVLRAEQTKIYEFTPDEPDTPACEYPLPSAAATTIAVNPVSGEVFYFNYKDRKIHQLSACDAQGEFAETAAFTPLPKTEYIYALAFNPDIAWDASRPAGILYAADQSPGAAGGVVFPGRVDVFAPAEVRFPVVEAESVSSVTATTATLRAQVNPKGSNTRYIFQYLTKAAYEVNPPGERFAGASEAPIGGTVLAANQEASSAAASLVGLAPDTEYRYRAIATSHCNPEDEEALCEGAGEDQAFRTFPVEAPGLPDERAWELVSPAQKNGGEVMPLLPRYGTCGYGGGCKPGVFGIAYPRLSSPDGEAVVYEGFPFSAGEGAAVFNEYLAKRTTSGWQTKTLAPALMGSGPADGYDAFDAELTQGVLSGESSGLALTPEAPSGYANLYAQPTATPTSLTPLVAAEPPNRSAGGFEAFHLQYAGGSTDLSHLLFSANDALTGETPFAPEAVDGGANKNNLYESIGGQLRLVNVLPGNVETVPGALFGSGTQIEPGGNPDDFSHTISDDGSRVFWSDQAGQVYVRINGESTIAIPDAGKFLTASADGSKVLLSNGHLYDVGVEGPSVQEAADLSEGEGGFVGILGQSDDLSRIYFVDTAALTSEGENDHGAKAEAGKNNLYEWFEGEVSYIATLATEDRHDWTASPSIRSAEASPDGRWLAFLSREKLTGYENVAHTCLINSVGEFVTAPCPEAFLYDSQTGTLVCPSCNPSGARPAGPATLGLLEASRGSMPQPRYLTNSGRLYFDSEDSLVPADTNLRPSGVSAEDVYQYEPEGVGAPPCERKGGCVSLISAGHESDDSNFLAMDATGKNVFFTTRDQLVLKDRDDLMDLYVAREGGGIAAETETSRGECQGEACVPAIVPPNDPTPGSSSFEGAGNVDEQKATKKHKHKKHRHSKKAHRNRAHKRAAHHNRGGAK